MDRESDPCGGNVLAQAHRRAARPQPCRFFDAADLRRARHTVFERDAYAQLREGGFVRFAFDLHIVGLGKFVPRIGNAVLLAAIVGQ